MVTSYVNTTAILQSERSFKGVKEGRQRRSGSPLERHTKYIASSHGDYFLENAMPTAMQCRNGSCQYASTARARSLPAPGQVQACQGFSPEPGYETGPGDGGCTKLSMPDREVDTPAGVFRTTM